MLHVERDISTWNGAQRLHDSASASAPPDLGAFDLGALSESSRTSGISGLSGRRGQNGPRTSGESLRYEAIETGSAGTFEDQGQQQDDVDERELEAVVTDVVAVPRVHCGPGDQIDDEQR